MDANQIAAAAVLWQTKARMARVGLIVDPAALSAANRRALTALHCLAAHDANQPAPVRPPLGFAYAAASATTQGASDHPVRPVDASEEVA